MPSDLSPKPVSARPVQPFPQSEATSVTPQAPARGGLLDRLHAALRAIQRVFSPRVEHSHNKLSLPQDASRLQASSSSVRPRVGNPAGKSGSSGPVAAGSSISRSPAEQAASLGRIQALKLDNLSLTQIDATRSALRDLTLKGLIEAGPGGRVGHLPASALIDVISAEKFDRFTPEVLPFLKAEREFRADPTPARAQAIADAFLRTGVELQVNVSSQLQRQLLAEVTAGPQGSAAQFPADLFTGAVQQVYDMMRPVSNNPGEKTLTEGLCNLLQPALDKVSTQQATRAVSQLCEHCTPAQWALLPRVINQLDITQIFAPGRKAVAGIPMDVLSNALRVLASEPENRMLDFLEAEMHFRAGAEKDQVLSGRADWAGSTTQFEVMVSRYVDPESVHSLAIPDDLRANLLEAARTSTISPNSFDALRTYVFAQLNGLMAIAQSTLNAHAVK